MPQTRSLPGARFRIPERRQNNCPRQVKGVKRLCFYLFYVRVQGLEVSHKLWGFRFADSEGFWDASDCCCVDMV